ncbi:LysR substrate-binding domain-containing protein [Burkholderia sp. FERM BP-3421]|jgi:DNA-binding transcriptional LysR family regulator|uniref:LysR family transcriptional regulator n=1 Tax=Burkholderia sp. FERM BP-3421 TaxID=1494466 RepID=UPI00235F409B|nr:LysR family transcriptional regulator [Burkholderia sp. FERM BP-3421]WDD95317.1 LysR substrate-binding domain-containing protein [Burkholderia sp. FERM BP-3421]
MNISLRQLRAFTAVARHGGFTEAARAMHVTQSALSLLVKELEADLGFRLFDRTTRKVSLSQAGEEFLPLAERILDDLRIATQNASSIAQLKRGIVRVCAPQIVACTLLPPALAAYRTRFPDIRVRLVDTLLDAMLNPVLGGEADFAIGPDPGRDDYLAKRPLFRSPHVVWCRPDHPFAGRRTLGWDALAGEPLVATGSDFAQRILPQVRARHPRLALDIAHEAAFVTTGFGLVAAGLGINVGPDYLATLAHSFQLTSVKLRAPVLGSVVCAFHRRDRPLSPAAASLLAFLAAHLVAARGGA